MFKIDTRNAASTINNPQLDKIQLQMMYVCVLTLEMSLYSFIQMKR